MKSNAIIVTFFVAFVAHTAMARADAPTPLDATLAAGQASLIAVPVRAAAAAEAKPVPLMHYRLHLPGDYHQTGAQTYPVMFIAAPGGGAEMGQMRDALVRDRWIVAMLVESRNGSQAWLPNFTTAYDDLVRRVRVDPDMMFCTGLSGAAKVCSVYPGIRPGFQAVILQAAGPWTGRTFAEPGNDDLLVYGTFGTLDGNFHHARRIRISLPESVRRLVEIWDGGHAWAPADVFDRALVWSVDAVVLDRPYSPTQNGTYRWYVENRLAEFDRATSAIDGYVALTRLSAMPPDWQTAADPALIERVDTALNVPAPAQDEIAAYDAFAKAMAQDESDRGHNSETIASLYKAIADQYPGTAYGERAATRHQAVLWETGKYP